MSTIRPFLAKTNAFQPEAVEAMSKAYEEVCEALKLEPDETHERETVAERIMDLARTGVLDANTLRDRVMEDYFGGQSPTVEDR